MTASSKARRETEPNVVVFGGGIEGSSNMVSRRPQMKAFMVCCICLCSLIIVADSRCVIQSSKVSKLTQDDVEEDEEDDTQENDDLEMFVPPMLHSICLHEHDLGLICRMMPSSTDSFIPNSSLDL